MKKLLTAALVIHMIISIIMIIVLNVGVVAAMDRNLKLAASVGYLIDDDKENAREWFAKYAKLVGYKE